MTNKPAKKLLAAALLGVLTLGTVGCTDPIAGKGDPFIEYPGVTLSEDSLKEKLGFQKPIISRVDNNLMRVTLPVRARSTEELHVEYKVVWMDEAGIPLRPEGSWTPLTLEKRQPTAITVNATSSDATKFNIQWRWSRK